VSRDRFAGMPIEQRMAMRRHDIAATVQGGVEHLQDAFGWLDDAQGLVGDHSELVEHAEFPDGATAAEIAAAEQYLADVQRIIGEAAGAIASWTADVDVRRAVFGQFYGTFATVVDLDRLVAALRGVRP